MFAFTVSAGQKISIDEDKRTGSNVNGVLRLFNGSGQQLAISDNHAAPGETLGTDAYLEYTFTTAGKYYLGVSASGNSAYNATTGAGDTLGSTYGAYSLVLKNITPAAPAPAPMPEPEPTPEPTPAPTSGDSTLGTWFTANLHDSGLMTLSSNLGADGSLNRTDMIDILASAGLDGSVNATELTDLRTLVANAVTVGMPDYVKVLSGYVVNTAVANAKYLGQTLGNLVAGSTAGQLDKLIDKWFFGADHPVAKNPSGSATYTYRLAAGQLFVNGAAYTDIRQGQLGDCYFLATLGSIAQRDQGAIEDMFINNGDGTYTVRFFRGGTADYVTVDRYLPTTSSGYLAYQGSNQLYSNVNGELWAALAEKAYAQINEQGWIGQNGTNSYQGISGGWMESVAEQVLGRNATSVSNTSASTIINALAAGKMVTAGSKSSGTSNGVVGSHAYIVTGYDSATQTFKLYNPWGTNQPAPLTWNQFAANFTKSVIA
jgi:hypothetical protein